MTLVPKCPHRFLRNCCERLWSLGSLLFSGVATLSGSQFQFIVKPNRIQGMCRDTSFISTNIRTMGIHQVMTNQNVSISEPYHTQRISSVGLFPCKLHDMLNYAEDHGLEDVISWTSNGRSFKIHSAEKLAYLLPRFFGQTKFRSFQRQLHLWSFEKVRDSVDRGAFAHPFFMKGKKSLVQNVSRESFKKRCLDELSNDDNSIKPRKLSISKRSINKTGALFGSVNPNVDKVPSINKLALESKSTVSRHLKSQLIMKAAYTLNLNPFDSDSDSECNDKHVSGIDQRGFHEGESVEFEGRHFFFLDLDLPW